MKKYFSLSIIAVSLMLFTCKEKTDVSRYLSAEQRDTLLTDIITYVYIMPQYSDWKTRFESRFRKYYASQLDKFTFQKYYIDANGTHYFYIIRPALSAQGNIRGVGGTFRLDESGKIISFKEIFNTPVATLPELQQRGRELFNRMIKYGHVDEYLKHPDYIEWPDKITYYDTLQHEWLIKPGI